MNDDNLIAFQAPELSESFNDALTQLVRQGARQIIAQAVEAELKEFLAQYQSLKDGQGRQAIVRNGYLPERTIMTGVGEEIQVPKVVTASAVVSSSIQHCCRRISSVPNVSRR